MTPKRRLQRLAERRAAETVTIENVLQKLQTAVLQATPLSLGHWSRIHTHAHTHAHTHTKRHPLMSSLSLTRTYTQAPPPRRPSSSPVVRVVVVVAVSCRIRSAILHLVFRVLCLSRARPVGGRSGRRDGPPRSSCSATAGVDGGAMCARPVRLVRSASHWSNTTTVHACVH